MSQSVDRVGSGVVKVSEGKEPVQSEKNVRTAQSPDKPVAYQVGLAIACNLMFLGLYQGYRNATCDFRWVKKDPSEVEPDAVGVENQFDRSYAHCPSGVAGLTIFGLGLLLFLIVRSVDSFFSAMPKRKD